MRAGARKPSAGAKVPSSHTLGSSQRMAGGGAAGWGEKPRTTLAQAGFVFLFVTSHCEQNNPNRSFTHALTPVAFVLSEIGVDVMSGQQRAVFTAVI